MSRQLLCLVIELKILLFHFVCDFSCTLRKLQVIAGNSDWFIMLFSSVVIVRSNYIGIGFSTVI